MTLKSGKRSIPETMWGIHGNQYWTTIWNSRGRGKNESKKLKKKGRGLKQNTWLWYGGRKHRDGEGSVQYLILFLKKCQISMATDTGWATKTWGAEDRKGQQGEKRKGEVKGRTFSYDTEGENVGGYTRDIWFLGPWHPISVATDSELPSKTGGEVDREG